METALTMNLVLQKTKNGSADGVRKLNVCGAQLNGIDVLAQFPNLEVCSLSVNDVYDLSVFGSVQNITELYMRRNNVSDFSNILHLAGLRHMRVLSLTENPVAQHPDYRSFVIACLPQLQKLDADDISADERAAASHMFPDVYEAAEAMSPIAASPLAAVGSAKFAASPRRSPPGEDLSVHRSGSFVRKSPPTEELAPVSSSTQGWDSIPVGGQPRLSRVGSASVLPRTNSRTGAAMKPVAKPATPVTPASTTPTASVVREESVVRSVNILLNELSPASLLAVRNHLDMLSQR
jgi:hypothetical protein